MRKIPVIIFIACICFFSISSLAYSAVDILLKIDGLEGESAISGHEGEIDILSWSWNVSNTGTMHIGGGGGAGKAIVGDLSVTKYIDKSSTHLILASLLGTQFKEAILIVSKAGENPLEYLKITMSPVIVTNVSSGGSGGDDRLTESVTLNFAKVCYAYTPQKEDGTGDAEISRCFNIEANLEE